MIYKKSFLKLKRIKMIVTVGNTKGGVGKTTIAVNIAIARRLTGRDIWLIDADRQGTAQMAIRMRTEAGEHKDLCVVHAAALRHCECRYQQAFRQKQQMQWSKRGTHLLLQD